MKNSLNNYLYLGLKFGLIGGVLGFLIHVNWGTPSTIWYTTGTFFLIGFFNGFLEWAFSGPKAIRLSYSILLLLRSITYFFVILIFTFFSFYAYIKNTGYEIKDLSDPEVLRIFRRDYLLANINGLLILFFSLLGTFIWQLQPFFGKGVLLNYLSGKYHKPILEERIFMFLDLNDATTHAEKLGSQKYSALVTDFFRDIDGAITATRGQVFQYVGDEVVIIWKPKQGLKNNNCLRAFFLALEILEYRKAYYQKKYGVFPRFKAALHIGDVTIAEVGVSKKEIAYHGDTINATARICASVHKLNKRLLLSKSLFERLNTSMAFEDLGVHTFKGKKEQIHILGY